MSNNREITESKREYLKSLCDEKKYHKKVMYGASYTSKKACEVSSLFGLEGGDYVATYVDEVGSPIALYCMGRESLVFTD